jgi:hypothetical protein
MFYCLTEELTDGLTAKLLLVLASTVILRSGGHATHDKILLFDGSRSLHTTTIRLTV